MSFRICETHNRLFSSNLQQTEQKESTQVVQETVYVVDEDTGEIKEEQQYVERPVSLENDQRDHMPFVERKESSKVFPLAMKKTAQMSFM